MTRRENEETPAIFRPGGIDDTLSVLEGEAEIDVQEEPTFISREKVRGNFQKRGHRSGNSC